MPVEGLFCQAISEFQSNKLEMSNLIIVGTVDFPLAEDCYSSLERVAAGDQRSVNTNKLLHEGGIVQVAQGIEEISRLLHQFPEVRILATGASNTDEQIKALKVGAIGACLEESTVEEIELAIRAVVCDSLLVTPFREILVLPFAHRRKKLAKITASLGAKLLKDWRMQGHSALLPVDKFVQNLNIGDESLAEKLIAELDKLVESKKIEFITSKTEANTCLQHFQTELEAWMIGSERDIGEGGSVIERLGAEVAQKRQIILTDLPTQISWEKIGTFCLYNWMRNIVPFLRAEARKYEQMQKAALLEEMQSLKALKVLENKLRSKPDSHELLEGALNVLRAIYSAKIKVKICGGFGQIAFDLIETFQGYLNLLSKSEGLINQIEQKYLAKSNNFKCRDIFCSDWSSRELRNQYEIQSGISIHNLGILAEVDQKNFKEEITKLLYPYAFQAYINSCLNFFE